MNSIFDGECRWRGRQSICRQCCTAPKFRHSLAVDTCPHDVTLDNLPPPAAPESRPAGGPGTEMTAILEAMKITAENCACKAMARKMDTWGPEGCEGEHAAEIIAHLEREARARAWMRVLPFKALGARGLLKLAVYQARQRME